MIIVFSFLYFLEANNSKLKQNSKEPGNFEERHLVKPAKTVMQVNFGKNFPSAV